MLTRLFSARSKRYNSYFDGIGQCLHTMSKHFQAAFTGNGQAQKAAFLAIKTEETAFLAVITALKNEAGNSLLSPLDREDVHFLTSDLRLLSGNMLHMVGQTKNLGTTQLPASIQTIVPLITGAITELAQVLSMLKNISKLTQLTGSCRAIRQTLYNCDVLIDDATTTALHSVKDPLELIKVTDYFAALQRLLEKIGDVVDNSETIIIKYS